MRAPLAVLAIPLLQTFWKWLIVNGYPIYCDKWWIVVVMKALRGIVIKAIACVAFGSIGVFGVLAYTLAVVDEVWTAKADNVPVQMFFYVIDEFHFRQFWYFYCLFTAVMLCCVLLYGKRRIAVGLVSVLIVVCGFELADEDAKRDKICYCVIGLWTLLLVIVTGKVWIGANGAVIVASAMAKDKVIANVLYCVASVVNGIGWIVLAIITAVGCRGKRKRE